MGLLDRLNANGVSFPLVLCLDGILSGRDEKDARREIPLLGITLLGCRLSGAPLSGRDEKDARREIPLPASSFSLESYLDDKLLGFTLSGFQSVSVAKD